METSNHAITIKTTVNAPIAKVWNFWSEPDHVRNWNNASPDWHTPKAENDLREGGKFSFTMAAKDGSFSFDFGGEYTQVVAHKTIAYVLEDARKVTVVFEEKGDSVEITETFDPENQNDPEFQRQGWQAILDNFKKYIEGN
ncbi:SRPBCC family protein [Flavobacterium sp.]|uniref:SRPBCC family protein n=1 Tax=Flavobacterium sp. TaxID=239 RepID=UPI0012112FD0|nr:SRPBCC family protein [Flavobacterium sp.]RZJ71833.1 MAG: polyketide cyclase [Flavobacterium sp.]